KDNTGVISGRSTPHGGPHGTINPNILPYKYAHTLIPRYPSPPHSKAGIVKLTTITNTLPLSETSPFRDRRLPAQTHF
ncbi:hypothetical protein A2U01_0057471, partial [Trifolium medium]|nr:hypothetical protein [Trifolium medium]